MTTMLVTLERHTYLRRLRAYKGDEEEFRQLVLNALVFDALADPEDVRTHGTLAGHLVDTLGVSPGTLSRYVTAEEFPGMPARRRVIETLRSQITRARRPPVVPSAPQGPVQQDLPLKEGPSDDDLAPLPLSDVSPFGRGFQK